MSDVEKLGRKAVNVATLGLFEAPDMPKIEDPALAPDPESLEVKRANEREIARRKKSGRTSTVMSDSNTLG